ncbi:hypothetical protein [Allonocardiopsis opalescens]|uniref:Uncharacterized protein n=1 Tax=Allonocardiopsis opalescens TaxID=1144618 RepID=A0A2T0Q9E2_9ACTN|nr:hypothetical protein [Allonocardiopsis opalescens]PRY00421.1 hypothetical protein CLV72_10250 [Allonocardiopsis opalescens]
MSSEQARKLIEAAAGIEFATNKDVSQFSRVSRDGFKTLAMEFDFAAEEIEARLRAVAPGGVMEGFQGRARAKAVARHARNIAEFLRRSATESVRINATFVRLFEAELNAAKAKPSKKPMKFEA